jgi:hypothetical protein
VWFATPAAQLSERQNTAHRWAGADGGRRR